MTIRYTTVERPSAIRQVIKAGSNFNALTPMDGAVALVPELLRDTFAFEPGTQGGLFDITSSLYTFERRDAYYFIGIELKLGGQSSWKLELEDSFGTKTLVFSGTTETSFVRGPGNRIAIPWGDKLLLTTVGGTDEMVATLKFFHYITDVIDEYLEIAREAQAPWETGSNPGPDNDAHDSAGIGQYFEVGDFWLNTTTHLMYQCIDATPHGAQWVVGGGAVASDHKVSVDGSDTSFDYLDSKITATGGLQKNILGVGGKTLQLSTVFGTTGGTVTEGNDARLSDARTPVPHASSHRFGGSDLVGTATPTANAIPIADASGTLNAWITGGVPSAHAATHKHGGVDEVATETPAPRAIPKADNLGTLDAWVNVVATRSVRRYYADGTAGDDGNSGLSAAFPKKTLGGVFGLIPEKVQHDVVVHLIGVFDEPGDVWLERLVRLGVMVLIDGGNNWTDVGGGVKTVQSGNVHSLTVAATPWATDEHAGYVVKVLSGAAMGDVRTIYGNSFNQLVVSKDFSGLPTAGDTFQILAPTTEIKSNTNYSVLHFGAFGDGTIQLQRVLLSGTKLQTKIAAGTFNISGVVSTCTQADTVLIDGANTLCAADIYIDPSTLITDNQYGTGFGMRASNLKVRRAQLILGTSFLTGVTAVNADIPGWGWGTRVKGAVNFDACHMEEGALLDSDTLYAKTKIDGSSGAGLTVRNRSVVNLGAITVSGCGSHGVHAASSIVNFKKATEGTGNGGAGLYVHRGSIVGIESSAPPTLTGTVGDVAILDAATVYGAWTEVSDGDVFSVASEMTLVRTL